MITSIFIAGASALFLALVKPYLAWFDKNRSLKRVHGEPLYAPGAKIVALYEMGVETPRMVDATVESLELGRIVVVDSNGNRLPMTVQEFENMHVVVAG